MRQSTVWTGGGRPTVSQTKRCRPTPSLSEWTRGGQWRVWSQCDDLWKDFLDTCDDVEAEEEKVLTLMTGAVGARLLFDSVQRPGAVIDVTLAEYQRAREVRGVWVVTVLEHKTSAQGPACLTLTADTKRYVQTIRLTNDPFEKLGNLVVLPGGNPVTHLNNLLEVSRRYSIFIPTSTRLRQKSATLYALRGSDTQVRLVSKLMSHSASTHRRYYEQLGMPPRRTRWQRD